MIDSLFIIGDLPFNVEKGIYQLPLVILSYMVASFASYTALSLAQQLTVAKGVGEKRLLHWGGAFAMGAGIWSMHFIGMLSYKMDMVVTYDPPLTFLSMLIAIAFSYSVLWIVARQTLLKWQILAGGILLGLGICSMHYTGMTAMEMDGDLRYMPGLFSLSVAIAIAASAAALWMTFTLARNNNRYRYLFQIGAALIMGAAVCGMHYTGMLASVFIPWADCRYDPDQDFTMLAISVAIITSIILGMALSVGFYKRTQTEFQLYNSESKLRLIIDNALDAVISMDQQGLITEWNKQAETIFGWTYEEAIGRPLTDTIIPPEDRKVHKQGLQQFLKDGRGLILNQRIEIDVLNRHGESFPVELAVTPQKLHDRTYLFTAFIRDITARKEAEKTTALLAAIVESSEDAIISKTLDGIITSWNTGAEHLFGYSASEAVGQHISLIIPPERIAEEKNIITELRNGKTIERFETVRLNKEGRLIDISVTISPIRNSAGQIIGASKIVRDITARKRTELEVKKYQEELEKSYLALSDFTHTASHDLKSPLRRIAQYCDILKEDMGDKLGEDGTNYINRLGANAKRLQKLVDDLLTYSRTMNAREEKTELDFQKIADEVIDDLKQPIEENHATVVAKKLPIISAYPVRIRELLQNLVENALKYRRDEEDPVVTIACEEEGLHYLFSVQDNGKGIDKKYHESIFKAFERLHTHDEIEGSGLGLSICAKVVEMHNGKIWVESNPGFGSAFKFTIPKS